MERYDRPRRDDFEAFDRPVRKAAARPVRRKKKKESGGALLYWGIAVVLALLIGFGVRTFGFEMISVRGDAMRGTLAQGEVALVKKSVYYATKPARGDIVAVNSPEGQAHPPRGRAARRDHRDQGRRHLRQRTSRWTSPTSTRSERRRLRR